MLYENIYEEMNKIDDEASLQLPRKSSKKDSMNELFGLGAKKYRVYVDLLKAKKYGIDKDSLFNEIQLCIAQNGGKTDGRHNYTGSDDNPFMSFQTTEKNWDKIADAVDEIQYKDVESRKGKQVGTVRAASPQELNKRVREVVEMDPNPVS